MRFQNGKVFMELNGKTLGGRECLGRKHHSSANFKTVTHGSLYTGCGVGAYGSDLIPKIHLPFSH